MPKTMLACIFTLALLSHTAHAESNVEKLFWLTQHEGTPLEGALAGRTKTYIIPWHKECTSASIDVAAYAAAQYSTLSVSFDGAIPTRIRGVRYVTLTTLTVIFWRDTGALISAALDANDPITLERDSVHAMANACIKRILDTHKTR